MTIRRHSLIGFNAENESQNSTWTESNLTAIKIRDWLLQSFILGSILGADTTADKWLLDGRLYDVMYSSLIICVRRLSNHSLIDRIGCFASEPCIGTIATNEHQGAEQRRYRKLTNLEIYSMTFFYSYSIPGVNARRWRSQPIYRTICLSRLWTGYNQL